MERLRVTWSGWTGANGVSTFYFADAALHQAAVKALWTALNVDLPSATAITVASAGDIITDYDGELTGAWTGTTLTPQGGGDTGGFNAASGFMVKWLTDAYSDGSRIVGRTYFVPASRTAFDTGGNVAAATRGRVATAAQGLVTTHPGNMYVWRRPRQARAAWTGPDGRQHPAVTYRGGSAWPVTGAECPAKAVVLRSRRD
jgi:hypothetical protein